VTGQSRWLASPGSGSRFALRWLTRADRNQGGCVLASVCPTPARSGLPPKCVGHIDQRNPLALAVPRYPRFLSSERDHLNSGGNPLRRAIGQRIRGAAVGLVSLYVCHARPVNTYPGPVSSGAGSGTTRPSRRRDGLAGQRRKARSRAANAEGDLSEASRPAGVSLARKTSTKPTRRASRTRLTSTTSSARRSGS
jgi:hypothetical protein